MAEQVQETPGADSNPLIAFSAGLAAVVEGVAPAVVRVDDGTRLTATGLIWDAGGVIVTTSHGTERDEDLAVELADGSRHTATLVGRDPDTDLAVLRIEATGLPTVAPVGEMVSKVGQLVLAVARPGGLGLQATLGVVSAYQDIQTNAGTGFLAHTDAAMYPGFSGGALVAMDGRVIGILNRAAGRGPGVTIGSPLVAQVAEALLAEGRVRRGYLGIRTQFVALPDSIRAVLPLPQEAGLLLSHVENGSPAEQGGLMIGDILLAINEKTLEDVENLRGYLPAGQTVTIRVLRGGAVHDQPVMVGVAE